MQGSGHQASYNQQNESTYNPHKFSGKIGNWPVVEITEFINKNSDGAWEVTSDKKATTHKKECKKTIQLNALTSDSLRSAIQQHEAACIGLEKKRSGQDTTTDRPEKKKQLKTMKSYYATPPPLKQS
jgi:hypothetical protein